MLYRIIDIVLNITPNAAPAIIGKQTQNQDTLIQTSVNLRIKNIKNIKIPIAVVNRVKNNLPAPAANSSIYASFLYINKIIINLVDSAGIGPVSEYLTQQHLHLS